MRTELRNHYDRYPRSAMALAIDRIVVGLFRKRVRGVRAGTPSWHRLQERLCLKSSATIGGKLRNIFYMETLPECGRQLFVHPHSVFYYPQNVVLGHNVFINRNVMIMAPVEVRVGSNVLIGPYTILNSGNHRYQSRSKLIDEQGHSYEPIHIGDDVWIGGLACILPGVTVASGAVVAAGAVVTRSVAEYSVVGGVPARIIGGRDGE